MSAETGRNVIPPPPSPKMPKPRPRRQDMSKDCPASDPAAMQLVPPAGAVQRLSRACHGLGKPGAGMELSNGGDP